MSDVLSNPVWYALTGPQSRFAIGAGLARQYPRDVAPFAGLADGGAQAYSDLARDLPHDTEARLFRPADEPLPDGWVSVDAFPMLQMVAAQAPDPDRIGPSITSLTSSDTKAMLELVALAKPGPFGARTSELGRYVGIRENDRLLAMAGERIRVPGYVEVSGIATHPDARGRGFASTLTRELMRMAFARGEVPFLHVRRDNSAVALYRNLGFEVRREIWVLWRKPTRSFP